MNRWWELLDANSAVSSLTAGCAPFLLEPPVNVLRLSLHPEGLAPRIVNLDQWRAHLLEQLRRRTAQTGDRAAAGTARRAVAYPGGIPVVVHHAADRRVAVTASSRRLRAVVLFSIAATIETAADVTVDELAIESFFTQPTPPPPSACRNSRTTPLDRAHRRRLSRMASTARRRSCRHDRCSLTVECAPVPKRSLRCEPSGARTRLPRRCFVSRCAQPTGSAPAAGRPSRWSKASVRRGPGRRRW